MQKRRSTIAIAMVLRLFCINPPTQTPHNPDISWRLHDLHQDFGPRPSALSNRVLFMPMAGLDVYSSRKQLLCFINCAYV